MPRGEEAKQRKRKTTQNLSLQETDCSENDNGRPSNGKQTWAKCEKKTEKPPKSPKLNKRGISRNSSAEEGEIQENFSRASSSGEAKRNA